MLGFKSKEEGEGFKSSWDPTSWCKTMYLNRECQSPFQRLYSRPSTVIVICLRCRQASTSACDVQYVFTAVQVAFDRDNSTATTTTYTISSTPGLGFHSAAAALSVEADAPQALAEPLLGHSNLVRNNVVKHVWKSQLQKDNMLHQRSNTSHDA